MARIKGATMTHKRRKKMLKLAKGFYGCRRLSAQKTGQEKRLRALSKSAISQARHL